MNANKTSSWATLSASAPIYLTSFFLYVYKSFKENGPCREFIKPARMKYFLSGLVAAFSLFSVYLVFWVIAYKTSNNVLWYVALPLVMILGLVTIIYLSLYEFCVSFDIFYSKNKEKLVHNFLERASGKKLEILNE